MAKEKVVLNGQPVGRIKAGWLLFKESFRFMWADREMLWLPIISCVANLLLLGLIVGTFMVLSLTLMPNLSESDLGLYLFIFLVYVVGAFTLAFSQAAVAHMVFVRAHEGDATLMDSLKKAFSHWFGLLMWSVITSTVGLALRALFERSQILGKIVAAVIGAAWGVLTYFVVPAIVIDDKGPFESIKKSGMVFKQTWGESLTSNISFVGIFAIAHIAVVFSVMGVVVLGVAAESAVIIIAAFGLLIAWAIAFSLVSSSISAVLRTLLYIYATEGTIPQNFNQELLEKMLVRKGGAVPAEPPVAASTTSVTSAPPMAGASDSMESQIHNNTSDTQYEKNV